jgi:hypothetical protein
MLRLLWLAAFAALPLVASLACSDRRGAYVVGAAGSYGELEGGSVDHGYPGPVDADMSDAAPIDAAAASAACVDACDAAQNIGCASDEMQDCLDSCEDFIDQFPMCAKLWTTYNACAALAPKSAWRCDSDGFAELTTACTSENSAAQTCFHTH